MVENVEHDGRPARLIIAARTYDTSVEDLWDAVTNIERIPRRFRPISGELQVGGGRYQLEGNARGEVLRCDPPRSFEITWEYGGEDGRGFIGIVSDAWCVASIAAGTEPSAARQAADRTTEAYTTDDSAR
jgi:uncharacterized protein YndB with AHSA1/START domain